MSVQCETNIGPSQLLKLLKSIESEVGRVPSVRNGPRTLDLDVIFYGNEILNVEASENEEALLVPHPRLSEREFVLQPLSEYDVTPPAHSSRTNVGSPQYNPRLRPPRLPSHNRLSS